MTDSAPPPASTGASYRDDDLVYVDPDQCSVVGLVQWSSAGRPKSLEVPVAGSGDQRERRSRRRRYFPWGTYRSMKRIYKLEGKVRSEPPTSDIHAVIEKALEQPYWDS
jgi:hypothetical protein